MNLRSREMPMARRQAEDAFAARLQASGRTRGIFAAKKSDTEGDLLVYDVIGEDFWTGQGVTAKGVAEKLAELKGVSQLNVYINSPGGDLFEGKTVYNEIKRFPAAEKIVHVDGIAASAASLIAMAGSKIITESGGTWLVHEVAMWASLGRGTAEDHRKTAAELDVETQSILGIYEERTKTPADKLAALMRRDTIIGAPEAKSYGLTDEISEVEENRAKSAAALVAARAGAAVSPRTRVAAARAQVRTLKEKFPGASPGVKPGEPGTKTAGPASAGKGK